MKKFDKDIVEVYAKRVYNENLIWKRAEIEKIEKEDKFKTLVDEYNKNIKELLEAEGRKNEVGKYTIYVYTTSDETRNKIEEVEKQFKDKMDDRDRKIEEVRALEELYDLDNLDKLYKQFGILDKDGKIYDYKNKVEEVENN